MSKTLALALTFVAGSWIAAAQLQAAPAFPVAGPGFLHADPFVQSPESAPHLYDPSYYQLFYGCQRVPPSAPRKARPSRGEGQGRDRAAQDAQQQSGQQDQGAPSSSGGDGGQGGSGSFSGSGGMGSSGATGSAASSPAMELSMFGLGKGSSYGGRATYADPWGLVTVSLDYAVSKFSGSKSFEGNFFTYAPTGTPGYATWPDVYYQGEPYSWGERYSAGDRVEAVFNTEMLTMAADVDVTALASFSSPLRCGPRIEWLKYYQFFKKTNLTQSAVGASSTPNTYQGSSDLQMLGLGGFAKLDLAAMTQQYPTLRFRPYLKVGASASEGKGGRHSAWELLLTVVSSNPYQPPSSLSPKLAVEVGYVQHQLRETCDDRSIGVLTTEPFTGLVTRDDMIFPSQNSDFTIGSVIARAYVTF